ncbi:MAG TPA: cell wall-binding repeat-containing protein, partial [Acidothermaceae bacterium]|nr:cell wall-binding repeat-containing protein [Acidothermaceae bacterium]
SNVQPTTGTISGTVTGVGSAPIPGACITLESSAVALWPDIAVTNAQGAYTITGVTPNQSDPYEVALDASCGGGPNANYLPYTSPDFNVVAGQTSTVNAALTLGGSITGRVFLGGVATGGVCVVANAVNDARYAKATSAGDGTYVLGGMTPDTYTVQFEVCNNSPQPDIQPVYYGAHADGSPTSINLAVGQQIALGDQAVQLGGEVDLKLTDGLGQPLTDVFPIFFVPDASWAGISYGFQSNAPDANGYWHTYGLLPKSYDIEYFYCDPTTCRQGPIGYYPGQGIGGTPTPVTPVAGGAAISLTDAVSIPANSTSLSLVTFSPSAPTAGQTVTFKATITDPQTGTVPTGEVDFLSDAGPLGTANLDSHGVATLTLNTLAAGVYNVYSSYIGDGDSGASSSSTVTVTVGAAVAGGGGGGASGGGSAPMTAIVPAGGSASSDPAGTTPSASNPLVVGVTSPTGGTVTIDKTPPNTSVAHYTVLGLGATITAPPATSAEPLTLTFQVFDKQLPAGAGPADLTVFRDGVAVGTCTGPGATPDPCVASATTTGGVTTIVIRSSHASKWDVEAASVGRVSGTDRIATAVAVSQNSFPAGNAGAVVLARGDDYPDALVGGPLAAAKNAPLLLTEGSTLPAATATELKRVLPAGGTVYVLGGTSAVPATVASQLSSLGYSVVRYSGTDRYATAVAVAKALGTPTTVLLATGTNFPDALAAGPAAAHVHGAILLTNGSTVPTETATYLASAHTTYAIGGPAAAAVPSATAILGSDRYATAAAVATKFFPSSTVVGVATGAGFPDALAGGAQLALMGAPLLLSSQASVPTSTSNYLNADHTVLTNVYVYGGTAVLGTSIVGQLTAAFGS